MARTLAGVNTESIPRNQTFVGDEEKAKSEITSLIGISLMSSDRARSFIGSEIPSWRLTDTVKDAVEQWNKEVLSKTQVPLDRTANMAHVRLLYSSLYFMYPMPSNRTGDNPLWRKVSEWVSGVADTLES
ncbi:hypothetical protein ACP6JB_007083 [Aspergillus fumigatus]